MHLGNGVSRMGWPICINAKRIHIVYYVSSTTREVHTPIPVRHSCFMTHTGAPSSATEPKPPAPHLQSWEKSSTHGADSWLKPRHVSSLIPTSPSPPTSSRATARRPSSQISLQPVCSVGSSVLPA